MCGSDVGIFTIRTSTASFRIEISELQLWGYFALLHVSSGLQRTKGPRPSAMFDKGHTSGMQHIQNLSSLAS